MRRVLVIAIVAALVFFHDASAQGVGDRLRRLEDQHQAFQRELTEVRVAVAERTSERDAMLRLFDATHKSIDRLQTTLMFALGFLAVIACGAIAGAVNLNTVKLELGIVKRDVGELKTDVGVLKTDVAGLKMDVGVLKTDVGVLKTDVAVLKTDVAAGEGLLKNLYERLGERYPRRPDAM
jgi:hypothetical protein